jgi:hypothetical protein
MVKQYTVKEAEKSLAFIFYFQIIRCFVYKVFTLITLIQIARVMYDSWNFEQFWLHNALS